MFTYIFSQIASYISNAPYACCCLHFKITSICFIYICLMLFLPLHCSINPLATLFFFLTSDFYFIVDFSSCKCQRLCTTLTFIKFSAKNSRLLTGWSNRGNRRDKWWKNNDLNRMKFSLARSNNHKRWTSSTQLPIEFLC